MPSNPTSFFSQLFQTNHRSILSKRLRVDLAYCIGRTLVLGAGHDPYREYLVNSSKIVTNDINLALKNIDIYSNAESIPAQDRSFDSIAAIEVFEHVDCMSSCVSECSRLLKKNGILVISMPFMFHIHGDPSDFRRLTINGLSKYLINDYDIISALYFGNLWHVICDSLSSSTKILRILRPFFRITSLISYSSNKFPSGLTIVAKRK